MDRNTNSPVTLDTATALDLTAQELNLAMIAFDRWASQNPEKLDPNNQEFKDMKQMVKLLRLRMKEQQDMQRAYNTAIISEMTVDVVDSAGTVTYARPRNTEALLDRPGTKLGSRSGIKLSRG